MSFKLYSQFKNIDLRSEKEFLKGTIPGSINIPILTNEEYQKKVEVLRKKVSQLQKNKQNSLKNIAKLRNQARTELLKNLNPLMREYMEKFGLRLILETILNYMKVIMIKTMKATTHIVG